MSDSIVVKLIVLEVLFVLFWIGIWSATDSYIYEMFPQEKNRRNVYIALALLAFPIWIILKTQW